MKRRDAADTGGPLPYLSTWGFVSSKHRRYSAPQPKPAATAAVKLVPLAQLKSVLRVFPRRTFSRPAATKAYFKTRRNARAN